MSRHKANSYSQCSLKHPSEERYTISWIPAQYAVPNKLLSLETDGIWEDWVVQSAGPIRPASSIEERQDDYRKWFDNDI